MKINTTYKRGISMLEVLIVLVIISILAGLSWSAISKVRKTTKVDNSCDGVIALANKARGMALSGEPGINAVKFSCVTASCTLSTRATTGPNVFTPKETYTLESGTHISASPVINMIYNSPYGNSSATQNGSVIDAGGSGINKTFTIGQGVSTCN